MQILQRNGRLSCSNFHSIGACLSILDILLTNGCLLTVLLYSMQIYLHVSVSNVHVFVLSSRE